MLLNIYDCNGIECYRSIIGTNNYNTNTANLFPHHTTLYIFVPYLKLTLKPNFSITTRQKLIVKLYSDRAMPVL